MPPQPTDLDAFRDQYATTVSFTEALKTNRCRRTDHFEARLGETMAAFQPLFAPWNMEIVFLLYMRGAQRFNGVKGGLGGVSSRVLTDKLRHLVGHGILDRREADDGRRVTYALTTKGQVVARHLHPLVFYLHNEGKLRDLTASP